MPISKGECCEVPDDSVKKTIIVALGVCIVCSVLVSTAAVSLQGIQEENKRLDKIKNILLAADLFAGDEKILSVYEEKIKPVMIDIQSGEAVEEGILKETMTIERFDIDAVAADPEYSREIPDNKDMAGINRIPSLMVVYFIEDKGKTDGVVLPVYGRGLWSTLYGFMALDRDLKTVKGITFYDHAETPGLGGEVDNPRWKGSWKGKQAMDESGKVKIEVLKGVVDMSRPEAKYQIDGLSGATLTTRGVDGIVKFWLGNDGYGPLLKRFKEELHGKV
jgi:Na+-transporting NADH:ubiquinone oxidoreductase subunit C